MPEHKFSLLISNLLHIVVELAEIKVLIIELHGGLNRLQGALLLLFSILVRLLRGGILVCLLHGSLLLLLFFTCKLLITFFPSVQIGLRLGDI